LQKFPTRLKCVDKSAFRALATVGLVPGRASSL